MFKNLVLQRPLVLLDLETTGTNPQHDRIIEISALKVSPDGRRRQHTRRLNPGVPIPAAATAVHGISDVDVADKPRFDSIAQRLLEFLDGCDLAGFNLKRFDLRLLHEEFKRAGCTLSLEDRAIVDVMEIYHTYEPRDLTAAVHFYCNRQHPNSHSAQSDVLATADVLDAMLARYDDLPRSVAGLQQHFNDPDAIDSGGRFKRVGDQIQFTFGKHRGLALEFVARTDVDYLQWMLAQDFLDDTKAIVRKALVDADAAGRRRRGDVAIAFAHQGPSRSLEGLDLEVREEGRQ